MPRVIQLGGLRSALISFSAVSEQSRMFQCTENANSGVKQISVGGVLRKKWRWKKLKFHLTMTTDHHQFIIIIIITITSEHKVELCVHEVKPAGRARPLPETYFRGWRNIFSHPFRPFSSFRFLSHFPFPPLCFHLYYLHFCISLYTCANVICIKLLLTYLPLEMALQMQLTFWRALLAPSSRRKRHL